MTVGGIPTGEGFYDQALVSMLSKRAVIDEAACNGDVQLLVAQTLNYLGQTYPRTTQSLQATRTCINCAKQYCQLDAFGQWQCRRHARPDRSCCPPGSAPSDVRIKGCVPCDHQDQRVYDKLYGCEVGVCAVPEYLLRAMAVPADRVYHQSPAEMRLMGWAVLAVDPLPTEVTEQMCTVLTADLPLYRY